MQQLGPAAERAGADGGAVGQGVEGLIPGGDQGVGQVLARRDGIEEIGP